MKKNRGEEHVKLIAQMMATRFGLTFEQAYDITVYALGCSYVVNAVDDKIRRLIDDGFFKGIRGA